LYSPLSFGLSIYAMKWIGDSGINYAKGKLIIVFIVPLSLGINFILSYIIALYAPPLIIASAYLSLYFILTRCIFEEEVEIKAF
jgi:hypothetical protein